MGSLRVSIPTAFTSGVVKYSHCINNHVGSVALMGRWVALVAGLLIILDPFYLSDSRVNRSEALIAD